jgi:uncharacterized protein YbjT (DUF2867 family)
MSGITLVTGGNIGNYVVEGLQKKGKKIRVTTVKIQPKPAWDAAGIEQIEFDYARPETVARAFDGIDAYFSVSPLIENLSETGIRAVNAAKKAGVRRIVRSSALGASDNAVTFPRWHRAVEKAIEDSGISYTILQPNAFMQNHFAFVDSIKKQGKFYAPLADSRMSVVDARDIADAAVVALTEPGHDSKKYKVTGGEAISSAETARALSEAIAKPVEYVAVSSADAKNAMAGMGMPLWMINGFLELYQLAVDGWLPAVIPDLERLLGRKPRTFQQFAQDFREAFV